MAEQLRYRDLHDTSGIKAARGKSSIKIQTSETFIITALSPMSRDYHALSRSSFHRPFLTMHFGAVTGVTASNNAADNKIKTIPTNRIEYAAVPFQYTPNKRCLSYLQLYYTLLVYRKLKSHDAFKICEANALYRRNWSNCNKHFI